jgi:hypothetical protein
VNANTLKFAHRFAGGALCEIAVDLERVRDGAFVPRFIWSGGTRCSPREHVEWLCEVFAEISDRTCDMLAFEAPDEAGRWERWLCLPGSRPKRVRWAPKVFRVVPLWQEEAKSLGRFVLRFGQHRGKCLRDVDPGYLVWVLRNFTGLWPETRNAIERYLETLH